MKSILAYYFERVSLKLYTCYGLQMDGRRAGALALYEGRLHLDDDSAPHLRDERLI